MTSNTLRKLLIAGAAIRALETARRQGEEVRLYTHAAGPAKSSLSVEQIPGG